MDVFSDVVVPSHRLDEKFDVIINSSDYGEIDKRVLWPIAFKALGDDIHYGNSLLIEDGSKEPELFRGCGSTEKTLALLNPRQFEIGQLLVIPRRHAPTILDLTDDEAGEIMKTVRIAAEALIKTFKPDGITVYQNNGVASLQEVPHFHMHVVPRRKSSNWGSGPPHIATLQPKDGSMKQKVTVSWERAEEIASIIRPNFKTI